MADTASMHMSKYDTKFGGVTAPEVGPLPRCRSEQELELLIISSINCLLGEEEVGIDEYIDAEKYLFAKLLPTHPTLVDDFEDAVNLFVYRKRYVTEIMRELYRAVYSQSRESSFIEGKLSNEWRANTANLVREIFMEEPYPDGFDVMRWLPILRSKLPMWQTEPNWLIGGSADRPFDL